MGKDKRKFWADPAQWPVAMPGYVFLASAVLQIGRARFPEAWDGAEPWAEIAPRPIPDRPPEMTDDVSRKTLRSAYELLQRPIELIPVPGEQNALAWMSERSKTIAPLSPEDWVRARGISTDLHDQSIKRLARWVDAVQTTEGLFRSGTLVGYTRPVEGLLTVPDDTVSGYTGPMSPSLWSIERTGIRFSFCCIDWNKPAAQQHELPTNRPTSSYDQGEDYRYIFVTEESLQASIKTLSPEGSDDLESEPSGAGGKFTTTTTYRLDFIAEVQREVRANLAGDTEDRGYNYWISRGMRLYRLPKREAEPAYVEAVEGVDGQKWRKRGPKPKAKTNG